MKRFENLTSTDYKQIASDIITLSKKDENELLEVLGHAAHDSGIDVSDDKNTLFERVDMGRNGVSPLKAFRYVANTAALDSNKAKRRGRRFWHKLRAKVQKAICGNQTIQDIIAGKGTLQSKLAVASPAILALIGGGIVLGPVYITIISIALAIIIKAGLDAYCEMDFS